MGQTLTEQFKGRWDVEREKEREGKKHKRGQIVQIRDCKSLGYTCSLALRFSRQAWREVTSTAFPIRLGGRPGVWWGWREAGEEGGRKGMDVCCVLCGWVCVDMCICVCVVDWG